jgi:hypothetical protein
MARRPDGWQGIDFSWLVNCAESSEILLNSGISVEKHLYIQVILSNQNEANYKLTNRNRVIIIIVGPSWINN